MSVEASVFNRRLKVSVLAALAGVCVVLFVPIIAVVAYVAYTSYEIRSEKSTCLDEKFYSKFEVWVLERRSNGDLPDVIYFDDLPTFLFDAGCSYVIFEERFCDAEFGGGFYHYGIRIDFEEDGYVLNYLEDEADRRELKVVVY